MSLAALNQPALVGVSGGLLATVALPALERAVAAASSTTAINLSTIKLWNGLLFGLNLYATSQPGRIDGTQQEGFVHPDHQKAKAAKKVKSETHTMDVYSTGNRGRTLLAPAGWTFAIWGPIFVGEFLFCASSLFLKDTVQPCGLVSVVKRASSGFMIAQLFQVLWTASFRPKYVGHGLFVSSAMLSGIAYSLSRAHAAYADKASSMSLLEYVVYFLPMTLHFGWTSAAALVNINGNVASRTDVSPQMVAWLGHGSAMLATALGVFITLTRHAPVYGGVIAWALTGCAAGMTERLEATKDTATTTKTSTTTSAPVVGVHGAGLQRILCGLGAVINVAASAFVTQQLSGITSSTKK